MGCVGSRDEELEEDVMIRGFLKTRKEQEEQIAKVLLLGPGESGKSTVFRQMMIGYGKGISDEERLAFVTTIRVNIVKSLSLLAVQGKQLVKDPECLVAEETQPFVEKLMQLDANNPVLDTESVKAIRAVWRDSGIQNLVSTHLSKFQIPDSICYFIERLDEISQESYLPNNEDLIRVRVRTTGILQDVFEMNGRMFRIVDMGGQRSERKKWVLQFDSVVGILFIVAANEFDQTVWETLGTNRMHEALEVFEQVISNPIFRNTTVVLFLNKADLFEEKIRKTSLGVCFPEWDSSKDGDAEAAWKYIEDRFARIASVISC